MQNIIAYIVIKNLNEYLKESVFIKLLKSKANGFYQTKIFMSQ